MMNTFRMRFAALVLTVLTSAGHAAHADHPEVLATPAQLPAIQAKIADQPWAKAAYAALKAEVDPLVARTANDPQFVTSRMLMNWDTHYATTLVQGSATVGGEGRAPVPTPRFEGARDWNTPYSLPAKIEDWPTNNDKGGQIYLKNGKTGEMEWVAPGKTGGVIRGAHQRVMGLAANAAFLYWVTGDERYARFASDILYMFMNGFVCTTAPKPVVPDEKEMQIIGPTAFEVIHENVVCSISVCYDFLAPYLAKTGRDTTAIQEGLRRWADRVTNGGFNGGNWNLNEALMIGYAGLALEPDKAYPDGKGREYYTNIVMNADLPTHRGLTFVLKEGFDPESALWPEAAGYGFGAAGQIIELSSLMSSTPEGAKILASPFLMRSLINQGELMYPNGLSEGVGDTTNVRMSTSSLENMLASAAERGDEGATALLSSYLAREIAAGQYDRSTNASVWALTRFVPNLPPARSAPPANRSFWFPGLNILMQRNLAAGGDPTHSLAAALYGTNGGHVHQNGLAVELYGAGYIQGADPGRGSSYWSANHREYYVTPVAHNTVIVNGKSTYNETKAPNRAMTIVAQEPASQQPALSPDISFAQASFAYASPAAQQMRTLALIRTSSNSGFYYDVFRSRANDATGEFHDYVYHNMGTLASVSPTLAPTNALGAQTGVLSGYRYLQNERSSAADGDIRATFELDAPGRPEMNLWMPSAANRTVFAADGPLNNAIRDAIDAKLRNKPMPTLIVRQTGEAWTHPFVAVYEPSLASETTIRAVRSLKTDAPDGNVVATEVVGPGYRVRLFNDATASGTAHTADDAAFQGLFAAVVEHADGIDEAYLGDGTNLQVGGIALASADGNPVSACIRRTGSAWTYSSTAAVKITLPVSPSKTYAAAKDAPLPV